MCIVCENTFVARKPSIFISPNILTYILCIFREVDSCKYLLWNCKSFADNSNIQLILRSTVLLQRCGYAVFTARTGTLLPRAFGASQLGYTAIDVLVKMIRVAANMNVNAEVGIGLGNTHNLGIIMLNLLNANTTEDHTIGKSRAGTANA